MSVTSYELAVTAYIKDTFKDGVNRNWVPKETIDGDIYFVSREDNLICFVPPCIQALRRRPAK